ncbi:MAG: hypothetical protein QM775_35320 [Pirellulales bacterium]
MNAAALLTTTFSPPNSRTAASIAARHSASFETSVRANTARPPALRTASTVAWPPASFKSATTTAAPSLANNSAMARPMPLPAPVTTADLFCKRMG